MQIQTLRMGPLGTNTYLVYDDQTGDGMLIDPAGKQEKIEEILRAFPGSVKYIVNTHGHADHVAGNAAAKLLTGADILIHRFDAEMLKDREDTVSRYLGVTDDLPDADILLSGGETVYVGSIRFDVLHTPGHTEGGICLFGNGVLFAGDTLFAGSIGRFDLPGGDYTALQASLLKLKQLPDDTVVYPGHGPVTTIGQEKATNRYMR